MASRGQRIALFVHYDCNRQGLSRYHTYPVFSSDIRPSSSADESNYHRYTGFEDGLDRRGYRHSLASILLRDAIPFPHGWELK